MLLRYLDFLILLLNGDGGPNTEMHINVGWISGGQGFKESYEQVASHSFGAYHSAETISPSNWGGINPLLSLAHKVLWWSENSPTESQTSCPEPSQKPTDTHKVLLSRKNNKQLWLEGQVAPLTSWCFILSPATWMTEIEGSSQVVRMRSYKGLRAPSGYPMTCSICSCCVGLALKTPA